MSKRIDYKEYNNMKETVINIKHPNLNSVYFYFTELNNG